MALDLYLDPISNDLYLENNQARFTEREEELVRQRVLITLRTFRGEWLFNINFGIPYLKNKNNPIQILGGRDQRLVDIYLRQAILSTEGVSSLSRYSATLNPQTRTLAVDFSVITESGNIVSVTGTV